MGEICVRLFYLSYTQGYIKQGEVAREQLKREVLELERCLATKSTCSSEQLVVRSRENSELWVTAMPVAHSSDYHYSHFFYDLEKRRSVKKYITCLLEKDGTPPSQISESCD